MATKVGNNELELQRAVKQLLDLTLPRDAVWHHSPNELDMHGPEAARAQAKARSMGTRKGWPDIEIMWAGRAHFIELKVGRNKLNDGQQHVGDMLVRAGARHAVCRSVGEVQDVLQKWGM